MNAASDKELDSIDTALIVPKLSEHANSLDHLSILSPYKYENEAKLSQGCKLL